MATLNFILIFSMLVLCNARILEHDRQEQDELSAENLKSLKIFLPASNSEENNLASSAAADETSPEYPTCGHGYKKKQGKCIKLKMRQNSVDEVPENISICKHVTPNHHLNPAVLLKIKQILQKYMNHESIENSSPSRRAIIEPDGIFSAISSGLSNMFSFSSILPVLKSIVLMMFPFLSIFGL